MQTEIFILTLHVTIVSLELSKLEKKFKRIFDLI